LSFSSTSDIVVILGMAIELAANILGISVTNDIVVSLTRSLLVLIDILTSTNVVDVTINRELYTNIVIDSVTEDVIVSVTRMLLADIQGTSLTSNDLILLLVALGMIIDPDSLTVLGEKSIGRKGGKSITSRSGKKTIVSK